MMERVRCQINHIPAIVWGTDSKKAYIYVHGKVSNKENAEMFAEIAQRKGYQTISFDLPEHGERHDKSYPCDIWNGRTDLTQVAEYVFERWEEVHLYGCSMGAHFSLYTYKDRPFSSCLFQSPIVDMDYMIERIIEWFHVSLEELEQKQVIETPFHTLTWAYYRFLKENHITEWNIPTKILYAGRDGMQSRQCMEQFASQYGCELTIAQDCDHGFGQGHGVEVERGWLELNI